MNLRIWIKIIVGLVLLAIAITAGSTIPPQQVWAHLLLSITTVTIGTSQLIDAYMIVTERKDATNWDDDEDE